MWRVDQEFAGVEGIEPSLAVLETAVLPLNDTPIRMNLIFNLEFSIFNVGILLSQKIINNL